MKQKLKILLAIVATVLALSACSRSGGCPGGAGYSQNTQVSAEAIV